MATGRSDTRVTVIVVLGILVFGLIVAGTILVITGRAKNPDIKGSIPYGLARTLKEHAEARGITAGQFATAWVLNNRLVTGVIAGPRTEAQWQEYLGALDYAFTPEDEALVDGFVAAGHPTTPGYNDPAYPLEGRVPRSG